MNVNVQLEPSTHADVQPLREHYLDSLDEPQDALLEVLFAGAQLYTFHARSMLAGYLAVHDQTRCVEFYLRDEALSFAHLIFPQVVEKLGLRSALVKTFDHQYLACALDIAERVEVKGMLVRGFAARSLPDLPKMRFTKRTGTLDDLPRILEIRQDIFAHPERLGRVLQGGYVRLYEREEALLGFGVLRPIIEGRPDVEVGIAVDEPYRNKGYAAYILRDLVDDCIERGLNPVSGCARDNEPSIRLGTRIGYIARHRLIETHFAA